MSFELIDSSWDKIIDRAVTGTGLDLRIICPFIKSRVAERFLRKGRPKSIQVLTRFHLGNFYDGVSDTGALRLLLSNGAHIRGVRNLHAKLYLFGQKQVVVTSANLTDAALFHNHEFGFVSDDVKIVARCHEYFEKLWKLTAPGLSSAELDDWDSKLTAAQIDRSPISKKLRWRDYGKKCGIAELESSIPIEPTFSGASKAFVKFFGESHRRADKNVAVVQEIERSGSHWACTYPKGKRPRQVDNGSILFMSRLSKAPADMIVYGRAVGLRHRDGRDDASPADIKRRPWKAKWPHYVRVHHAEFVAGSLANGISLTELMDSLGPLSFASTKRHAARGLGNTNPRKALMQQAAVELSTEGYAWLNQKLEIAFARYGKVPTSEIEKID